MIVASPAGQYLTLATHGFGTFPGSLLGVRAYIRQVSFDTDHYKREIAAYANHPAGRPRPKWPERPKDADPDEEDSFRTLELRDRAPSSRARSNGSALRLLLGRHGSQGHPQGGEAGHRRGPSGSRCRARSLGAAGIYGVADRLGSIESGKIANLVVTKGNLFDEKIKIEDVFIDRARVIDAGGGYVMPGIIDCHSHIAADSINEEGVAVSSLTSCMAA